MRIAVLGTGSVGRTLASAFARLGHEVTVGTRDVAGTLARTGPDGMGNEPYSAWAQANPEVRLAAFADVAADADLVVNATSGDASLAALRAVGEDGLAGRVVLDVANPLDFSRGFPPTLSVQGTDSLAEQLQRAFPQARVVKALNTMTASVMADPRGLADGQHTVFVCGDDAAAKKTVTGLLAQLGHRDVLDLGDLSTARGAEMLLPLWLRLYAALGTSEFNFKIVR
ncbi:NAD(P)-binding domain-containing protein [Catellatospora sp. KI3]|uniref:NADPH-dependent F420 reductase n=1 Tax=Catellatospora sp. KI3 TaxID=3041620 RepID=UPI00248325B6|nr:NAD(P)-binding domain-containing protein [Catellatospora sp. KI3]MDI1466040.1 NAD(P)-binding domain-containing protein [Catellatospora sp. KI3]